MCGPQQWKDIPMDTYFLRRPAPTRQMQLTVTASKLAALHRSWKEPVLIIHGPPGVGKTSLALEISQLVSATEYYYVNIDEFLKVHHNSLHELFGYYREWLHNATVPKVVILDDYKLSHYDITPFLSKYLQWRKTRIILVTEDNISSRKNVTRIVKVKEHSFNASIILRGFLPSLSTPKTLLILDTTAKSPLSLKLIFGALKNEHNVLGELLSRLSSPSIKTNLQTLKSLISLVSELLPPVEKGCARYISKFPITFPGKVALRILSMCGFSRPKLCLQTLVSYSLLENYTVAGKSYYKMPNVVKKVLLDQSVSQNRHENGFFQDKFCKYYQYLRCKNESLNIWTKMLHFVADEPRELHNHMCSGM